MDAQEELRDSIANAIDAADLNLSQNDEQRLEDQLIELLGYYNRAPEEERDEVYRRGEERILQSFRRPEQRNS